MVLPRDWFVSNEGALLNWTGELNVAITRSFNYVSVINR